MLRKIDWQNNALFTNSSPALLELSFRLIRTAGHVPGETWPRSVGGRGRHRRGGFGANRTLETSWVAVFKFRCLRPAGAILALGGHFLIIVKLEDHDVRVPILGMGRGSGELAPHPDPRSRPRRTFTILSGRFCWIRCSIWSTACDSRLMSDAVTIVVVRFSRQQGQPLLYVGQDLGLKAGADLRKHVNKRVISSDRILPLSASR